MTSSRVFADSNLDPRFRAGLVGHWIGGGSGLTWFDRSGYGNHGEMIGPTWTLGRSEPVLSFGGSTDYVSVPHTARLNPGAGAFSIALWIKPPAGDQSKVILQKRMASGGAASVYGLGIGVSGLSGTAGKKITAIISSDGFAANGRSSSTSADVVDGDWHHVVFTWEPVSNTIGLAVDGANQSLTSDYSAGTVGSVDPDSPLRLGTNIVGGGSYFAGLWGATSIYNRAISGAEIAAIASPSYSPIIGGGLVCGL